MARSVSVKFQGEMVEGEELTFESVTEVWNEYKCEDGARVRLRLVVSRVVKLVSRKNEEGEAIYHVGLAPVMVIEPPPQESK